MPEPLQTVLLESLNPAHQDVVLEAASVVAGRHPKACQVSPLQLHARPSKRVHVFFRISDGEVASVGIGVAKTPHTGLPGALTIAPAAGRLWGPALLSAPHKDLQEWR